MLRPFTRVDLQILNKLLPFIVSASLQLVKIGSAPLHTLIY
jgi:hypothetical protein